MQPVYVRAFWHFKGTSHHTVLEVSNSADDGPGIIREKQTLQQLLLVIRWGMRIYLFIYLFLLMVHILHL